VHGHGGDAHRSWGAKKGGRSDSMFYWLLDDPELRNVVGVWTLKHDSFHWGFQPGLTRKELTPDLLDRFVGLGEHNLGRRIVFVGHSDGGNVIKEMLLYCHNNKDKIGKDGSTAAAILRLTSKVFFIATPHRGTDAASYGSMIPLADKERAQEISQDSEDLDNLYRWWRCASQEDYGIESFSFIETKGMIGSFGKIVEDDSGWAGIGDKQFIPRNHNEIAKPKSPSEQPYYKICLQIKELLEEVDKSPEMQLVSSKPLCVKNNQIDEVECEKQVWRLLVVTRKHNGAYHPSNSGGFKLDLAIMLKLPDGSEYYPDGFSNNNQGLEWEHENLTLDRLAETIIKIYPCYEEIIREKKYANSGDSILLVNIFLPHDLLWNKYIYDLCSKIREKLSANMVCYDGLPLVFSCSSRYRLSCHENPMELTYSKSNLQEKSKEIVDTLSTSDNPMSDLKWNLIYDNLPQSIQAANDAIAFGLPQAISKKLSVAEFDKICDPRLRKDLSIDPLEDRHSLFLCWNNNAGAEPSERFRMRIQHILNSGIPLMWIKDNIIDCEQSSEPSAEGESAKEATCHADTLLGWTHGEFHARFDRYNRKRLPDGQGDEVGIRSYIRNGILFWEDHRFSPREMPALHTKVPLR
jgi:hypothetical protein